MATRDLLRIIRAARAGDGDAQCALGRHYLFGGSGLPRNIATALHWLDRAACQRKAQAWMLIGEHIPFETARRAFDIPHLLGWYEKAFEAGVMQAGLTFAQLVLDDATLPAAGARRAKAMQVLQQAAQAGVADAQWMLAQQAAGNSLADVPARAAPPDPKNGMTPLEWAASAADAGILAARYALAERAWAIADYAAYLHWSLPLAREVLGRRPQSGS